MRNNRGGENKKMANVVGHVALALDESKTRASFSELKNIVSGVVSSLDPVTLKLDVAGTTKEFQKLSKAVKEVADNIAKIDTSKLAGGGGSSEKVREQAKAYKEVMQVFERLQHYSKSYESKDPVSYVSYSNCSFPYNEFFR